MDNGNSDLREFGKFRLDTVKQVLWCDGEPVDLPPKEIELLAVLTEFPGEVVSKRELMDRLWSDSFVEESNLSRHVYRIRKTFEKYGEGHDIIQTVPRRGYRFTASVHPPLDEEFIVQRHSLSRTLVESIHGNDDPADILQSEQLAGSISKLNSRSVIAVLASVLILLAVGTYVIYRIVMPKNTQAPIRSIAVLPFRDLSPNGQGSFRSVAVADLLISKLSNVKDLSIRPTSSIIGYENTQPDALSVAQRLKVDGVIEGTLYEQDGKLLVTARLVRASDNSTVWSREFNSADQNNGAFQNELALQIATALSLDLSGRERVALEKRYSEFPDAMQMYQEGRYHWSKRTNVGLTEGLRLFRNAAKADPNFALAYVGIADSSMFGPTIGEATYAVQKALEIDPSLGEAYATRGFLKMFHQWDWDGAESDFKRSIELSPGYPPARQWYGNLLMIRGRHEEARAMLRSAVEFDPISANQYADLAQADYYAGDLELAEANAQKALEIIPDFVFARALLTNLYFATGRNEDAFREHYRVVAILGHQPHQPPIAADIPIPDEVRVAYQTNGIRGYWELADKRITDVKDTNANRFMGFARIKAQLGQTEAALDYLDRAVTERAFLAPFINADPIWRPLHGTHRFAQIRTRLGL